MSVDVTTVADDLIVAHWRVDDTCVATRLDDLSPDTEYVVEPPDGVDAGPVAVRTLPRPDGELLARVATVNDVHFGETVAGKLGGHEEGPQRRAAPGEPPYPETMNEAAVAEITAIEPDAVVVKGDLSVDGRPEEWAAFEQCYRTPFGDRLHVVRGNHDAYQHQERYAGDQRIAVEGLVIALLDTVLPGATTGSISADQLEWLDTVAAEADAPVIAMGHHQQWLPSDPDSLAARNADYFGLHPDPSDGLDDVCARRPSIIAYAAGHTHRHRVRPMRTAGIASIEVGCTKDFPGTWAEYRVYESGVMQVVHRMSSPAALAWSESCRTLYSDFGVDYATYALGTLEDRCFTLPLRAA